MKGMAHVIVNKFSVEAAKKLVKISEIAKQTGISRTTLTSLYYRRSSAITFDILNKLCLYFNCSVSDLFEYLPGETGAATPEE